ncbi:MAG: molybdopterin-binding protein [Candidatus Ruminococcus intestinipullorum]|nr:molybdopterin-binding protein [Candidatus Ruminococcus intestinipullorum]
MKEIKTQEALGAILCHDITQIIPGVKKEAVFKKGHVIKEEDIPVLLSAGKEHIYVWEAQDGMLHENDAAKILCEISRGQNLQPSTPKEGKIELTALCDGILKVNKVKLNQLNAMGQISIASRHGNFPVKAGDKIAGMRVIPLVIEEEKMTQAKKLCEGEHLFEILPFHSMKVGIVTTGSEVYYGRIQDTFTPVVKEKLREVGLQVLGNTVCNDDSKMVTDAILKWIEEGAEMVVCTGGMSVDPDDRTPLSIKNASDEIVTYGAPVLPGAMFMLAYHGEVPILGLPGCVMYEKRTIFDLVLPRLAAKERLKTEDFTTLGEGGLCTSCPICTFPNCGFGKGA